MSVPGGYGGAPHGQTAPQTGGGAWSEWSQFQQSVPPSTRAHVPAGYGHFSQATSLHVQGQIPGTSPASFPSTPGWQGPGTASSLQPQYPGYVHRQQQQQPVGGYQQHQHPGYYAQQHPGYLQQQQQAQYQLHQQQQMLLQKQQQRQQEEQARLAREREHEQREAEEKRRRALERQKHALMSIDIAKPSSMGSTDLESRIGLSLERASAPHPPPPSSRPTVGSQSSPAPTSSAKSDVEKVAVSVSPLPQDLPCSNTSEITVATGLISSAGSQGVGVADPPTDAKQATVTTTISSPSVDELLADSLSNLQLKANRPVNKKDFKNFSQTTAAMGGAPSPLATRKTYTPSEKSHNWTQSAMDFSGVFAEHSQHELLHRPGAVPPQDPLLGNVDGELSDTQHLVRASQSLDGGKLAGTSPIVATAPSRSPQLTRSYTQPQPSSLPAASAAKFAATDLPFWLAPCLQGPAPVPPFYNNVYQMCSVAGNELTITDKLFPLLMSSGLDRPLLGQLWALVNLTIPGQLTKVELFVLLGLIGLVQEGKPSTLAELKLTTKAPIPRLSLLQPPVPVGGATPPIATKPVIQTVVSAVSAADDFGEFQASATPPLSRAPYPQSHSPTVSKVTGELSLHQASPVAMATGPLPNPPAGDLQLRQSTLDPSVSMEKGVSTDDPYAALRALAPVGNSGTDKSGDQYSVFKELAHPNHQPFVPESSHGSATGGSATGSTSSSLSNTGTTSTADKLFMGYSALQPTSLSSSGMATFASGIGITVTTRGSSDDFSSFASFTNSSFVANPSTVAATATQKAPEHLDALKDFDLLPTKMAATVGSTSQIPPPLSSSSLDDLGLFPAKMPVTLAGIPSLPVTSSGGLGDLNLFPAKVVVTSASVSSLMVTSSGGLADLNLFPAKVAVTSAGVSSLPVTSGGGLGGLNLFPNVPFSSFSTEPTPFSSSDVANITSTAATDNWADFTGFVSSAPPTTNAMPIVGSTVDPVSQQPSQTVAAATTSLSSYYHGALDNFGDFMRLAAMPTVPTTTASSPVSMLDALPQMESKELTSPGGSSTATSEFGEFTQFHQVRSSSTSMDPGTEMATPSNGKLMSKYDMWKKCLSKCCELLEASVATLSEVSDTAILEEIARSEEARNKLKGIAELFRFAKRIHVASKGPGKRTMTPSKSESLNESMMEIKRHWNAIVKLLPNNVMTQILDSMSSPATLTDEDSQTCFLCLLPKHIFISPLVTIDGCSDQYTLETTEQNGRLLHIQCANFWTKCIGENLTFSAQQ